MHLLATSTGRRFWRALAPAAALLVLSSAVARAATVDAASCSQADVQSAVDAAADGDTVMVPTGSCTWSAPVTLSNDRGLSLMCAAEGACKITAETTAVLFSTLAGDNDRLYRISGFDFHTTSGSFIIWFDGNGTLSRFRIDHNAFSDLAEGTIAVFFGDTEGIASYYGVIDHNTLTASASVGLFQQIGKVNDSPPPSPLGTGNNTFIEDNTVTITNMTNAGRGCVDLWGGAALVWRHNQTLNCLVTSHGVPHAGGPQNFELYDNELAVDDGSTSQGVADGYRLFHHQGSGEFIAFNNRFTPFSGRNGGPLEMTHYRSATPAEAGYSTELGRCDGSQAIDGNRTPMATYYGYPCWRQPGRDFAGNLMPMYVWNNAWSDTGERIDMNVANPWGATAPSVDDHVVAERDYYNAVSASAQTSPTAPFDGTVGMGFGTLANRPTTCTTNPLESGGGVGYFATDDGPMGRLYQCSATDTWTAWYEPYPYPHPLVSGDPPPSPDAGVGADVDGGPGSDNGAAIGGCGCATADATRRGEPVGSGLLVLLLLALMRRCAPRGDAASR